VVMGKRMRTRAEVQLATESQNSYGEPQLTWGTKFKRWINIKPLQGDELWKAKQINAETTHRVRMHYESSLEPTHRLKVGARILSILSMINIDNRNKTWELLCKEDV